MSSKCAFCGKENSEEISITDSETLQELLICASCEDLRFFDVPERIKEEIKGYKELTIQQLERKIDEVIDNDIEYMKELKEELKK